MHNYINQYDKECYSNVQLGDTFDVSLFHKVDYNYEDDIQYALHTNLGSFTVLDRMTGYIGGIRDTETGYREPDGTFWLASGMYDIRKSGCNTFEEAIQWVKDRANTCIGV